VCGRGAVFLFVAGPLEDDESPRYGRSVLGSTKMSPIGLSDSQWRPRSET